MSGTRCNYLGKAPLNEVASALAERRCHRCGISSEALAERGEVLEICGDDYAMDARTGAVINATIALCPHCHHEAHLDGANRHNPCHVSARRSREIL